MGKNNRTENVVRVYENNSGDMIATDLFGVTITPHDDSWDGVTEYEYGPRSWATDQVDAAQRAYAEGYHLVSVDGKEVPFRG